MNGGDTIITRHFPSWTAIAPLGALKQGSYQVFAPNQNEQVYTDNWHGPYYGFRRVLETFEMTDKPIRFKPIDVYYHMYSGTKLASLGSLENIYETVAKQLVMPIFCSEYAQMVLDFRNTSIASNGRRWQIRTGSALRTVRLLPGLVPDLKDSVNIAGYRMNSNATYVHMSSNQAEFSVIAYDKAQKIPYVADANGRIEQFSRNGNGISFMLHAYVADQFRLANARFCKVSLNNKTISPIAEQIIAGVPYSLFGSSKTAEKIADPLAKLSVKINVDCTKKA